MNSVVGCSAAGESHFVALARLRRVEQPLQEMQGAVIVQVEGNERLHIACPHQPLHTRLVGPFFLLFRIQPGQWRHMRSRVPQATLFGERSHLRSHMQNFHVQFTCCAAALAFIAFIELYAVLFTESILSSVVTALYSA